MRFARVAVIPGARWPRCKKLAARSGSTPFPVPHGRPQCRLSWLGRKDSNPRMAESKSAALTSLATPQALLVLQERCERLAIQPPHDQAAHVRGHLGMDRPRLALGRKFGEYTCARPTHAGITESSEPFEMRRHFRMAPTHYRLEIVPPETGSGGASRMARTIR